MLESGVSQEIHVNHQDLQEDQNYIFNLTEQKQLRGKFVTAVRANYHISIIILTNYKCIPKSIQKGKKVGTFIRQGNHYFIKHFIVIKLIN